MTEVKQELLDLQHRYVCDRDHSDEPGFPRLSLHFSPMSPWLPYFKCSGISEQHIISVPFFQLPAFYQDHFPNVSSYIEYYQNHPIESLQKLPPTLLACNFMKNVIPSQPPPLETIFGSMRQYYEDYERIVFSLLDLLAELTAPQIHTVLRETAPFVDKEFAPAALLQMTGALVAESSLAKTRKIGQCELSLTFLAFIGIHYVCPDGCHVEFIPLGKQPACVRHQYGTNVLFCVAIALCVDTHQILDFSERRPKEKRLAHALRNAFQNLTRTKLASWENIAPSARHSIPAGLPDIEGRPKMTTPEFAGLPFISALGAQFLSRICRSEAKNDWRKRSLLREQRPYFFTENAGVKMEFRFKDWEADWLLYSKNGCGRLDESGASAAKHVKFLTAFLYFVYMKSNILSNEEGLLITMEVAHHPSLSLEKFFARIWKRMDLVHSWIQAQLQKFVAKRSKLPSPQWHNQRLGMVRTGFEITLISCKKNAALREDPSFSEIPNPVPDATTWREHQYYQTLTTYNRLSNSPSRQAHMGALHSRIQKSVERNAMKAWNSEYFEQLLAYFAQTWKNVVCYSKIGKILAVVNEQLGKFPITAGDGGFLDAHNKERFQVATRNLAYAFRKYQEEEGLALDELGLKQRLHWLKKSSFRKVQLWLAGAVEALGPEVMNQLRTMQEVQVVAFHAALPSHRFSELEALALSPVTAEGSMRHADFRAYRVKVDKGEEGLLVIRNTST